MFIECLQREKPEPAFLHQKLAFSWSSAFHTPVTYWAALLGCPTCNFFFLPFLSFFLSFFLFWLPQGIWSFHICFSSNLCCRYCNAGSFNPRCRAGDQTCALGLQKNATDPIAPQQKLPTCNLDMANVSFTFPRPSSTAPSRVPDFGEWASLLIIPCPNWECHRLPRYTTTSHLSPGFIMPIC